MGGQDVGEIPALYAKILTPVQGGWRMRVKGPSSRKRRKKILKLAKGYRGMRHSSYRRAKEAVMRALY